MRQRYRTKCFPVRIRNVVMEEKYVLFFKTLLEIRVSIVVVNAPMSGWAINVNYLYRIVWKKLLNISNPHTNSTLVQIHMYILKFTNIYGDTGHFSYQHLANIAIILPRVIKTIFLQTTLYLIIFLCFVMCVVLCNNS